MEKNGTEKKMDVDSIPEYVLSRHGDPRHQ
jgi:hypothetical protein